MPELAPEQRATLAASLIEQAPPGEVNDVINAIRAIIADDDALMPHAEGALRAYNLAQLTVVEHPANGDVPAHTLIVQSILSAAAVVPGDENGRLIDPIGRQSFVFDHINMTATGYEPYDLPKEEEAFRTELAKSLVAYTKNHYPTGQSGVQCSQFPLMPPTPEPASTTIADVSTVGAGTGTDTARLGEEDVVPEGVTETPKSPVEEGTAETADETAQEVQTDLVPEQVGGGADEPAPTPAPDADGLTDVDEVVKDEKTLEQVDEAVEQAASGEEEKSAPVVEDVAKVVPPVEGQEEVKESEVGEDAAQSTEKDAAPTSEVAAPATTSAPPKEQERVENPIYTLEIVGNRYKTDAFWTGRWRSRWTVDKASNKVSGRMQVDVHYFEQGNVQLATAHEASFAYPSPSTGQSDASQIVTAISKLEAAYQLELQDVYGDLGDKAFRSLRRALPVTRQKIDWEKVGGYSLGSDIGKATA